jgi:hypothetical protein
MDGEVGQPKLTEIATVPSQIKEADVRKSRTPKGAVERGLRLIRCRLSKLPGSSLLYINTIEGWRNRCEISNNCAGHFAVGIDGRMARDFA